MTRTVNRWVKSSEIVFTKWTFSTWLIQSQSQHLHSRTGHPPPHFCHKDPLLRNFHPGSGPRIRFPYFSLNRPNDSGFKIHLEFWVNDSSNPTDDEISRDYLPRYIERVHLSQFTVKETSVGGDWRCRPNLRKETRGCFWTWRTL